MDMSDATHALVTGAFEVGMPALSFLGFRGFEGVVNVISHKRAFEISKKGPSSFVNLHPNGTISGHDAGKHSIVVMLIGLTFPLSVDKTTVVHVEFTGGDELPTRQSFFTGLVAQQLGRNLAIVAGADDREVLLGEFLVSSRPSIAQTSVLGKFDPVELTLRQAYVRPDFRNRPAPIPAKFGDPICVTTALGAATLIANAEWR